MKALLFAALAAAFLVPLHAQDLAPELAPVAAKYKADLAVLEAQKAAAVARVQQQYFAALDSAEKTATTAGTLEVVAAIAKEREAVKSGLMAPAFPADLPKTLQMARKTYLDGAAHVAADLSPRRKAIDADYLRTLAVLQARAAANPDLAKQIAAEKEKLLASAAASAGGGPAAGGGSAASRNVVVNGGFDVVDASGHPTGWGLYGPGADTAFKVVQEGTNSILHMVVEGAPVSIGGDQTIVVPPKTKTVVVRGRVRGKSIEHNPGDPNWGVDVLARFFSEDGKAVNEVLAIGRPEGGWKTITQTGSVPASARTVKVAFVGWWVSGTFDFDDIEVEFR